MFGRQGSGATPVEKLTEELSKKTIQMDMMETTLNKTKHELEETKKLVAELRKEKAAKASLCTKLEETTEKLKKDVKQKEYAVTSLQEQIQSLKSKPVARSASRSESPGFLRSSFSERSPSSSTVSIGEEGSSQAASELMRQVEDLKKEVETLRAAGTTKMRSPLASSTGFGASPQVLDANRVRALNDEVSTWKDRSESLMSELQSTKRRLAAMENEYSMSQELVAQAQDAKEKAESRYKSAQEEVMQLRELAAQDSSALKSQLRQSQGLAARHASDADEVASHADALQKKIDALVTEREAMERAKDEALALANKAKDSARTALADKDLLSKELDEKVVSFASLKAKYDSLEASKRASDAQFEALCAKLNAAHSVAQMNEANAQAMAGTASKAEMDASQLLKRLEATQERCDAAELSMEGLRAQLESTQEELKAKCDEHNQLSNAFEEATTKMAALSVDGGEKNAQKNAALSANALLEEKISVLEKDVASRDATIKDLTQEMDSLNTLLIQRTKDLEHTELLLSNAKSAVESVTEKSALNASDFESHTSTIVDDLEKMKERAEKAERDAREAQELQVHAVSATKQATQSLDAVKQELEDHKELLRAESDRADALSDLLEHREEELKALRQEIAELKSKSNQAEDLLLDAEQSGKKMDSLHAQLTAANEDVVGLKDELESKQTEISQLIAVQKDKERKIESLEGAHADLCAQMEDLRSSLTETEDKLGQFEQRALQAEMKASDAQSLARDFEIAKEDAEKSTESLQQELEKAKEEIHALQRDGVTGADDSRDAAHASDAEEHVKELRSRVDQLEKLLEDEKNKSQNLEADLKTEKRRANAAAMKAAGLDASANTADQDPPADTGNARDDGHAHVVSKVVSSIFDKYRK
ncbi:hypothetical protein M9434_006992 [Picochlorum sp. BPE23]|nr:hypothetical protein M9434_006992 [Picochlorum sp. BPE23]